MAILIISIYWLFNFIVIQKFLDTLSKIDVTGLAHVQFLPIGWF